MVITWSPRPMIEYTVELDGEKVGLGAREEFIGRPGLWNFFWLNSKKVDWLLDWQQPPEGAPMHTIILDKCILSMDELCGGIKLELLCESLNPQELIKRIIEKGCEPAVKQYWDELGPDRWLELVTARVAKAKQFHEPSRNRGLLLYGKFPLQ